MVTVVKTPEGHKIIDQAVTAQITEDYVGDAVVTLTGHSLTTGDTVYITSDIDEYNGFWYVTVITADTFKISEHSESEFVEYYQDAEIEYYQTQPHDWSSIFLPIVYKATNDKWPTNSVNATNLIVLNADDNGFTSLTLAAPITANALEFIKITGGSTEANGVWQIVEVVLSNEIVINLPYELSGNLTGATLQYYYNNYQVKIKIYSGLPVSHPWYNKKPYAEVAELSLTPDENNEVMFSVADYIQGQVNIRNNPTLFSMPLNLDAFTGFYIATAETYDQSDNYSLYTSEAEFVDDDFEGYAIAGKLEFKNVYSGDYADYVYTSGSPAQWLTNRTRLLAVEGYYFDVSFIKNNVGNFRALITKYVADYGITEQVAFEDQGIGVYRIPITPDVNYDSMCVQMSIDAHSEEVTETVRTDFDLSTWVNDTQPGLKDWVLGAAPYVEITGANSQHLYDDYLTTSGQTYTYGYEFLVANSDAGTKTIQILFLDAAFLAVGFSFINVTDDGVYSGVVDITPSSDGVYIAVKGSSIVLAWDITALSIYVTSTITETIEVPEATVTEEICIDILEVCEVGDGFTPDTARRLTEDGGYRLLE